MYKRSTLILKAVITLIGAGVLLLCLFALPAGIASDNAGYYRPILIGMYVPALPFFLALFYAFKLLSYIDSGKVFSELSVSALRIIKYCAIVICGVYIVGIPYIFQVAQRDDAPGVALIGFIFIFGSLVVATAAAIFQKLVQNVVEIKSENDLTV
jgi:MFS family permease